MAAVGPRPAGRGRPSTGGHARSAPCARPGRRLKKAPPTRGQRMNIPDKVRSVSELTQEIKTVLEDGFASVWVAGEISNYRPASSGHVYLTLKDGQAQIRAVVWRGVAYRLRFDPHDGLDVIARGRLDVYPPHGEYKLIIEELQPKGLGAAELALRQL